MRGAGLSTVLKLGATAAIGLFYLALVFAAAHPRVSPEYAAHYLEHRADCWDPLGERGHADTPPPPEGIAIGRAFYPELCRYLRQGWARVEDWGVRVEPNKASLRLPPRPGAQSVVLTLRGANVPGPVLRTQFVMAGGGTFETAVPPGETQELVLPLPEAGAEFAVRSLNYVVEPALPPDRLMGRVSPILAANRPSATRHAGIGLVSIRYGAGAAPAE
ncbi:hypothetical protein ACLF3G_28465 [Falsiroseomonas sp. HC035]|uniref:hypothetical protein n=1 Tax=Falsiroseomonas sp. HC035 TaxID=3390999 RepID=UPI003D321D72